MVNVLTQARTEIKDLLLSAEVNAVEYVAEMLNPPVCVVLPGDPYVTEPVGENPFRARHTINMQLLVIGGKGTNKGTAEQIDSMLVNVIDTLDESDWEATEVSAPQEVSLKGIAYIGALIALKKNDNIEKEVI